MPPSQSFLEIRNLSKSYTRGGWLAGWRFQRKSQNVKAVDDVSLTIPRGGTFALVGESGSGKSTLAKCLVGLEEPEGGEIWFEDLRLFPSRLSYDLASDGASNPASDLPCGWGDVKRRRSELQLIFQDAATAFNPTFSVLEVITEPLVIRRRGSREERSKRALALMEQMGLPAGAAQRSPFELSGGERQRLAIARALAIEPKFMILDEVFSGLDLPIQKQIIRLLLEIQSRTALTYLVISHDLGLVAEIADRVAVMYEGRIVEEGAAADLFTSPQHAHTQALVAAAPVLETCSAAEEA
jgi:ABC-type glutathione transport system ATPase component